MNSVDTLPCTTLSGRRFTRRQLVRVQETVARFPKLSRRELALTICEHLKWATPRGRHKIESCLSMLEALEEQGVVRLPATRVKKTPERHTPRFDNGPPDPPIRCQLEALGAIRLERVIAASPEHRQWKAYLDTFHYLEYRQPVGSHLGYFVVCESSGRRLGCLLFSASAAWALAPRDKWIGWPKKGREKLLPLILSNDRFLIFPWIDVPNLASHVLSLATKQIAADWLEVYHYRPLLIETFVDPTHFDGTCYRAANWQLVGQTQGRGRLAAPDAPPISKKDIFLYPLHSDCREQLATTPSAAELAKRHRNDLRASRMPKIDDTFVSLWKQVVHIVHEVAAEYDAKWRQRNRVIDSLLLMLLIFRLVTSKNSQSYATTIDDLWDSCGKLDLSLPQNNSIVPSSFCKARRKLDEEIFCDLNRKILEAYAGCDSRHTWLGHRLFAVDGSKMNLPRQLHAFGYDTPGDDAHYPQGLVSTLYQLKSRLPFDFDLVSHGNERRCAMGHFEALVPDDVVVYDRGYFSYQMLHLHLERGIHAVFRIQGNSCAAIEEFLASGEHQAIVTIDPAPKARAVIHAKFPDLEIVPLKMRLVRYEMGGNSYCIGTTLFDAQRYPLEALKEVYHSRWGIEELYKVSKQLFIVQDFHAKTERGVKQELFAHFVLITINRLFANRSDAEINPGHASNSHDAGNGANTQQAAAVTQLERKTNFKNCIHVLGRNFEELLLVLHDRLHAAIERAFRAIVAQHQKVRPGRSYPRKSMRPPTKWKPSKEKRKAAKPSSFPIPSPVPIPLPLAAFG